MDWTVFGVVVALAVGVATFIGVGLQFRSYILDHPKRQLEFTVTSRRLVEATPQAKLEVRVSNIEVPDPHLVEFRLKSNSRADIPTSAFDSGKALKIRIQPGGALVLATGGAICSNGGHGDGWDWAEFEVYPQLIRKESLLTLELITNGAPGIGIESPLIDVPVVDVTWRAKKSDLATVSRFSVLIVAALLPLFALIFVPAFFESAFLASTAAVSLGAAVLAVTLSMAAAALRNRDNTPQA